MSSAFEYITKFDAEWLKHVPVDWEIINLGYVSKMIVPMRDKPTKFEGDIPWIRIEDFNGKYIADSKSKQYVSEKLVKEMNLKVFPIGTVLCTCSCSMGATAIVKQPLVSNQTFIGIVPGESLVSEYLFYLIQASAERLQLFAQGAIQQYLSRYNFEHLKIPLPSLKNQRRIVDFLNNKLKNLDELIKNKKKLIDLLEEKRQTLITDAVTKGLNSDVKMKDSGIAWIGSIPENWEVKRIKHIAAKENYSMVDGPFGSDLKNEEYKDEGVPIIQLNNIKNGEHLFNNIRYVTEEKALQLNKHTALPGDLVIAKMAHPVGRSAIVKHDFKKYVIVADCIKLSLGEDYYNRFINYAMNTKYFISQAELVAGGITRLRINLGDLKQLKLFIPPYEEQMAICEYLDSKVKELTDLKNLVMKQIEKLNEYRQSLIYEAVTGKIDVRDFEVKV